MKTQTTKKVANQGNYFDRVLKNMEYGWKYPKQVVTHHYGAGKWGNMRDYYYFDGSGFEFIGSLPSWAGTTERSSYFTLNKKIDGFLKIHEHSGIQQFITMKH